MNNPSFFHLDRRAELIVHRMKAMPDDMLVSTPDAATILDVSSQWLAIGRHKGYGPEYITLSNGMVRYAIGSIRRFCRERTHAHTAEYATRKPTEETKAKMRRRFRKEAA